MNSTATGNFTGNPQGPINCDFLLDSEAVKTIKTIAYAVLALVTLIGNGLVIAILCRSRKLRQSTINLFILNMSISDILSALFVPIRSINRVQSPLLFMWPIGGTFGSFLCKFVAFADITSVIVSLITLEVIAFERFFSVVFPMRSQPISNKKTCYIIIVITWLFASAWSSQFFYTFRLHYHNGTAFCRSTWEPVFDDEEAFFVSFFLFLVCFTIIPCALLIFLYCAIIFSLYCGKGPPAQVLQREERQRRSNENRRVTFMLVTVVFVFLLSWLPVNVETLLLSSSTTPTCDNRHVQFSIAFLSFSYPAINPFIYFVFSENYRKGVQELLCCAKLSTCWNALGCHRTSSTSRENDSNLIEMRQPISLLSETAVLTSANESIL